MMYGGLGICLEYSISIHRGCDSKLYTHIYTSVFPAKFPSLLPTHTFRSPRSAIPVSMVTQRAHRPNTCRLYSSFRTMRQPRLQPRRRITTVACPDLPLGLQSSASLGLQVSKHETDWRWGTHLGIYIYAVLLKLEIERIC